MPSIGVLEAHQKPTDKPRRIKRSGGQSLVRQQLAVWIVENVLLRMLAKPKLRTMLPPIVRTYIPAKLPSHKTPGTKAKGPVAEQYANCRACIVAANRIGRI